MDTFNGSASDKENHIPRTEFPCPISNSTEELLCPVSTSCSALSSQTDQIELRAYKLGKQKCSYNQVELFMKDIYGKDMKVLEAVEATVGNEVDQALKESCLKYNVRFVDNSRIHLYIYVVYATPYSKNTDFNTDLTNKKDVRHFWVPVMRSKCKKGCKGPVIRGLQRFGKMSRRVGNNNHGLQPQCRSPNQTSNSSSTDSLWKEPRHLYIAIDEAGTHVCPQSQKPQFRLLLAAYDDRHNLLGSTVSSPVRVLANNDAPLGAACFKLHCNLTEMHRSDRVATPISHSIQDLPVTPKAKCGRIPLRGEQIIQDLPVTPKAKCGRIPLRGEQIIQDFPVTPKAKCGRIPLRDIASTNLQINTIESVNWKNQLEKSVKTIADQEMLQNISVYTECDEHERHLPVFSEEVQTPSTSHTDENTETLDELCHRIFEACSLKQEGVITLRKFAIILGASRHSLMEVFCILEVLDVVQGQGKEKYIWLGSKNVESALQKIILEDGEHSSGTSSRESFATCDDLSHLVRRFCYAFLHAAKGNVNVLKLEYLIATIIHEQTLSYEQIKAMKESFIKISSVLSALNLITRKPGPSFQWMGSESVLAGLKPTVQPASPQCQGSTSKRKREDGDVLDKDHTDNFLTCAGNKTQQGNEPHNNETQETLSSITSCSFRIHSRYRESHGTTKQAACTETFSSIYNISNINMINSQGAVDVTKTELTKEDRLSAAKTSRCSISPQQYCGFSNYHERPNHLRTQLNSQCGSIAHCCCLQSPHVYPSSSFHCSSNDYGLCPPVEMSYNYPFDPLGCVQTFVSPQHINFFQQNNPDFLLNFVRYYRQLHHRIGRAYNQLPVDITYPSPSKPSYPFCVNHQNHK